MRIHKIGVLTICASILVISSTTWGVIKPQAKLPHDFPVTPRVSEQVWFWQGIFSKYDSETVVIHDSFHPQIIIDVIDFKVFSQKYKNGQPFTRKEKEKTVRKYVKRYETAIKRFGREGKKALRHGAMEERVFGVVSLHSEAKKRLFLGRTTIRSQTGLSDEFKRAAVRAKEYLPYMEETFRQAGLPTVLTRIVFVESMFNTKARSKRGASGIWQFMPRTARRFLIVNRFIDERNSPLKATEAAARLLKHNFRKLKSWPLAITAYNHGVAGMRRAIRKVGTDNFDRIIEKYKSNSFGFASRNFYAEFIAAQQIYAKFFPRNTPDNPNPMGITLIRLPKKLSVHQIIAKTPLDKSVLKHYNPCLTRRAYTSHRHRLLPKGYDLIVPATLENKVRQALNKRPSRKG